MLGSSGDRLVVFLNVFFYGTEKTTKTIKVTMRVKNSTRKSRVASAVLYDFFVSTDRHNIVVYMVTNR